MSLAHKLETSTGTVSSLLKEQGRATDRGAESSISLLRRVQIEPRGKAIMPIPGDRSSSKASLAAPEARKTQETHGQSVAISLIDEVSSVIPLLVDENETLRSVLKRDRERLEAEVERATLVACKWRQSAEDAKLQVDNLERDLAEMAERLERAEAQIQAEKELAVKSAREAAEAECLSSLFEEKLLTSFGAGSMLQTTLDRIRQRVETEVG